MRDPIWARWQTTGLRKVTIHLEENLVKQGVLHVPPGAPVDVYVFVKPSSFSSPSSAVVPDRNSNDLSEWKVKGEKRTYNDVKQARIAADGVGA